MEGDPVASSPQQRLSHEQKIGIGLLLIFAVTSVTLGFLQIRNRLYAPFALNSSIPGIYKQEVATLEALRFRDTDFDGLNDFDEQYVHGTSVYLADTDSDGVSDKQEVEKGTNPLCPAGQKCNEPNAAVTPALAMPEPTTSTFGVEGSVEDVSELLSNPKYIRELLVSNGMPKNEVDTLTDAQIIAMMKDAVTEAQKTGTQAPTR